MDWNRTNLNFERRRWIIPPRLIPVLLAVVIFITLWNLISASAFFWLTMPLTAILTWIASYGWRQALSRLIGFLHSLERF